MFCISLSRWTRRARERAQQGRVAAVQEVSAAQALVLASMTQRARESPRLLTIHRSCHKTRNRVNFLDHNLGNAWKFSFLVIFFVFLISFVVIFSNESYGGGAAGGVGDGLPKFWVSLRVP